jgi:hypothetical protein
MRPIQFSCLVLTLCLSASAEDVKLREQASQLLEIANAVSLPGGLPAFEQTVTFRVYEPDGSVKAGSYTRVSAGATGHRDETTFGDYHSSYVMYGDRVSGRRTASEPPPEVRELRRQLPILLVRFDQSDVIREIRETNVSGPLPGNNGQEIVDVVVHGYITDKGAVWRPVIDSSPNASLNAEALQLVSTWKFQPLMCNDKPALTDADFILHFQGR